MKSLDPELSAEGGDLLDLGTVLGQNLAFGLLAGRCSAVQAAFLRSLREGKIYTRVTPVWGDFCAKYLKMSRTQADQIIHLLDEFGPRYFELAQMTRISAETYRAIAPAVKDGALQFEGESIELSPENSRRVAAAVAELRSTLPRRKPAKKPSGSTSTEIHVRIAQLDKKCTAMIAEFSEIARKERCGENWLAFLSVLNRMSSALGRLEMECESL